MILIPIIQITIKIINKKSGRLRLVKLAAFGAPDRAWTCTSKIPDPKSGASANSATGALLTLILSLDSNFVKNTNNYMLFSILKYKNKFKKRLDFLKTLIYNKQAFDLQIRRVVRAGRRSTIGNRVTGYNLFEGSNPLLSAMKKEQIPLRCLFFFVCRS